MTGQWTATRKISSFAAPTEDDIAYFDSLSESERRALLRAEIEKGFTSLSERNFDEVVSEARAKFEARRSRNG